MDEFEGCGNPAVYRCSERIYLSHHNYLPVIIISACRGADTTEEPLLRNHFDRHILERTRAELPRNRLIHLSLIGGAALLAAFAVSCASVNLGAVQPQDLCQCLPIEPDIADFRHAEKHVPIPTITPLEITVDTILGWPQDALVLPDAPRSGRELQVFHVAQAFIQNVSLNGGDCDVDLEISATADKTAPRAIVETPVDSEYCSARKNIQSQLAQHGFQLDGNHGGELPQALPADILGIAFEDFEHNRGSAQVTTLWELHPAIVNLTGATPSPLNLIGRLRGAWPILSAGKSGVLGLRINSKAGTTEP